MFDRPATKPRPIPDPYGQITQTSGSSQSVFGFTSEETDATGLLNLRARYYNPAIGQFLNLDPLEGGAGNPLSLNRYAYVQNNPINFTDPNGKANNNCQQYNPSDPYAYAQCLKDAGINPCPPDQGYPIDGTRQRQDGNGAEPYCVNSQNGDNAGALWQHLWMPPTPPSSTLFAFQIIGGYVEGLSGTVMAGAGYIGGREVVYDFATFQRQGFTYNGFGLTAGTSAGGTGYVGHVEGFTENPYAPNNFDHLIGQYTGIFIYENAGLGLKIPIFPSTAAGIIHFHTYDNAVYGNAIYFYGGFPGFGIPSIDVGAGATNYSAEAGNQRAYITGSCGLVDRTTLTQDILNGAGSPQGNLPSLSYIYRLLAATAADVAAAKYNLMHGG